MALACALACALAAGVVSPFALGTQAGHGAQLVSLTSQGAPADGNSGVDVGGSLSHDGRLVTFSSRAANLPGGDGVTSQIYVRDVSREKTRLVSRKTNGDPADGDVVSSAISANGRYVVFFGYGDGLPGANGTDQQVWINDLEKGKTRLVSRAGNGDPGDGPSEYPSVSANGRYVVFSSPSTNLPVGNGLNRLTYVRDMKKGKTILASRTTGGNPAFGDVFGQSISANGQRAIFESSDPDLPGGDGSTEHIYLRDLDTRRTMLVDRTSSGETAKGDYASISGDGKWVGFQSRAAILPGGDGSDIQAYVRNVDTGKTFLVSRNTQGDPQDADAFYPHLSGDGRYVAFEATGANLPGGDGSTDQIYVRDMKHGTTRLLSRTVGGDPADTAIAYPTISLDGRFAAFDTNADNLGGDTNYQNAFRTGPIY